MNSPADSPTPRPATGTPTAAAPVPSTAQAVVDHERGPIKPDAEHWRPPVAGGMRGRSEATSAREASGLPSAAELEQTLQRLMRGVSMLVQAEKCVFLLHDRERNELVARPPALGFTRDQIRFLRLSALEGVTAQAFSGGEAIVVEKASELGEPDTGWLKAIEVRNLIAYPLVLERRDEQERIVDRVTVGVFLVLNKRGTGHFTPEDLRLLSVMARQVTAVITDAQLYLQLTEEKEQLQATLQSLGSSVIMVETTGHVSLLNPSARALFGLEYNQGIGQPFEKVIPQPQIVRILKEAVDGGLESSTEIEIELPGEHDPRIYQAQTALVRGERGGMAAVLGVVVIFNDITEIRNVERMKTAFVSTVSHELRTPLTSIKGFISTLLQDEEGYFDDEARLEFYQIIDAECDRLRRLIDDLLNVSRIESGRALQMNWSLFEPLGIIEKTMHAQRSYTDRHRLLLDFSGEVPNILGDSDKFDQIMTNLLSNAIKYSPQGGDVVVSVSSDAENFTLKVKDHGIGIPRDKLTRVFEKFERVDNRDTRQAGGTGLGLYLVKHLVERHQGTITLESEVGKGSTFTAILPLRPSEGVEELHSPTPGGPMGKTLNF